MDVRVATVTHYYNRIGVAVLQLSGDLNVGDTISILGHTTDFTQEVLSMEIEHQKIQSAGSNLEVALKVMGPVREGDKVYKVVS
jgi:hypothetical protein